MMRWGNYVILLFIVHVLILTVVARKGKSNSRSSGSDSSDDSGKRKRSKQSSEETNEDLKISSKDALCRDNLAQCSILKLRGMCKYRTVMNACQRSCNRCTDTNGQEPSRNPDGDEPSLISKDRKISSREQAKKSRNNSASKSNEKSRVNNSKLARGNSEGSSGSSVERRLYSGKQGKEKNSGSSSRSNDDSRSKSYSQEGSVENSQDDTSKKSHRSGGKSRKGSEDGSVEHRSKTSNENGQDYTSNKSPRSGGKSRKGSEEGSIEYRSKTSKENGQDYISSKSPRSGGKSRKGSEEGSVEYRSKASNENGQDYTSNKSHRSGGKSRKGSEEGSVEYSSKASNENGQDYTSNESSRSGGKSRKGSEDGSVEHRSNVSDGKESSEETESLKEKIVNGINKVKSVLFKKDGGSSELDKSSVFTSADREPLGDDEQEQNSGEDKKVPTNGFVKDVYNGVKKFSSHLFKKPSFQPEGNTEDLKQRYNKVDETGQEEPGREQTIGADHKFKETARNGFFGNVYNGFEKYSGKLLGKLSHPRSSEEKSTNLNQAMETIETDGEKNLQNNGEGSHILRGGKDNLETVNDKEQRKKNGFVKNVFNGIKSFSSTLFKKLDSPPVNTDNSQERLEEPEITRKDGELASGQNENEDKDLNRSNNEIQHGHKTNIIKSAVRGIKDFFRRPSISRNENTDGGIQPKTDEKADLVDKKPNVFTTESLQKTTDRVLRLQDVKQGAMKQGGAFLQKLSDGVKTVHKKITDMFKRNQGNDEQKREGEKMTSTFGTNSLPLPAQDSMQEEQNLGIKDSQPSEAEVDPKLGRFQLFHDGIPLKKDDSELERFVAAQPLTVSAGLVDQVDDEEKYFKQEEFHFAETKPQPLGMESGVIPDESITASSHDATHEPIKARPDSGSAWKPSAEGSFLQIDFGKEVAMHGVGTLGDESTGEWTTSYKLSVSLDGQTFETLPDNKDNTTDRMFKGNSDSLSWVHHCLHRYYGEPIRVRFLRFYPVSWKGFPAMRVEGFGFRETDDPQLIKALEQDVWTQNVSGCMCYHDNTRFDCACCREGGCQCPGNNRHQCVQCGYGSACGVPTLAKRSKQLDGWTKTETGCLCHWDNSRNDCACCKNNGCQCGSLNKNQCVRCGRTSECGMKEDIFGANSYCIPKTCPVTR